MSAKSSYYNYRNCKAYSRTPTNGRAIKTRRFFKRSGHRHDRRAVVEMLREEIESLTYQDIFNDGWEDPYAMSYMDWERSMSPRPFYSAYQYDEESDDWMLQCPSSDAVFQKDPSTTDIQNHDDYFYTPYLGY